MGKKGNEYHRLSEINTEAKTGICSIDGAVNVGYVGNNRYRCKVLLNARSRVQKYKSKYGIDITATEIKPCELCGGTTRVAYDHCHKSGKFRGWLCMKCNTALGLVNDDIALLEKMIAYLRK